MKKNLTVVMCFILPLSITACAGSSTKQPNSNGTIQWDFDHQLQFRQTQLAANRYQLEIIPKNRGNFAAMSTFLLRKSYQLCRHHTYQLEILQGIEGFDDRRAMPNYIFPSLVANVECTEAVESKAKTKTEADTEER
mgnify:FL=1